MAQCLHDVFIGNPVKAKASQPLVPKTTRHWKTPSHFRHRMVEGSVKACDLRQTGIVGGCFLDSTDFIREMHRRKRN